MSASPRSGGEAGYLLRQTGASAGFRAGLENSRLGARQPFYALMLASHLLFEGEASRLYQKLVKGEESVVQIQGGIDERRGPSGLFIVVIPKPGTSWPHS